MKDKLQSQYKVYTSLGIHCCNAIAASTLIKITISKKAHLSPQNVVSEMHLCMN